MTWFCNFLISITKYFLSILLLKSSIALRGVDESDIFFMCLFDVLLSKDLNPESGGQKVTDSMDLDRMVDS